MKVIVIKTGEVKTVNKGYALNYLLPRGLAVLATPARLAEQERFRNEAIDQKAEKFKEELNQAKQLDGKTIEFVKKVGKSGKIHGSLTKKEIALKLKILKTNVILAEPIKKLGEYPVELKFGQSLAKIIIKVKQL